MTVANFLTFLRVLLSPIFVILYLWYNHFGIPQQLLPYILLGLLTLSELTDAFDGYFARRLGQVSDFGKIVDPMADSISRISCFLAFTQGILKVPLLLIFVFIYRDFMISTLRTICGLSGIALAARPSGKIKAIVQAISIYLVIIFMIPYSLGRLSLRDYYTISIYTISCAALYTLYSALDYFYAHKKELKMFIQSKGISKDQRR